ncbi:MAG: F-box protein, partial [Gammaproteobacteria bacterium]|nr:F-box protein [Gammaproteobacteria bacterium]
PTNKTSDDTGAEEADAEYERVADQPEVANIKNAATHKTPHISEPDRQASTLREAPAEGGLATTRIRGARKHEDEGNNRPKSEANESERVATTKCQRKGHGIAQTIQKYDDKCSSTKKISAQLLSNTNDESETRGTIDLDTGQGGRGKAPRGKAHTKQNQTGSAPEELTNKIDNSEKARRERNHSTSSESSSSKTRQAEHTNRMSLLEKLENLEGMRNKLIADASKSTKITTNPEGPTPDQPNEPQRKTTNEEGQDYDDDLGATTIKTMEGITIQELPNEMIEYICYYLTYKDMSRLGATSKRLRKLTNSQ